MNEARLTLDREEVQIHQNLLHMARLTSDALESAADALFSQNAALAQEVIDRDGKLNTLLRLIESECLIALGSHRPIASSDLRDILASIQIAAELERIGDHAKQIAKIVLNMDSEDFSGPMDRLVSMSDLCMEMVVRVLEAFENRDEALARAVAEQDCQVDELDEQAASSLMMQIMTHADTTMHATHLLWIIYHLERIGDRVTNIAERVVFMVTGETPELN